MDWVLKEGDDAIYHLSFKDTFWMWIQQQTRGDSLTFLDPYTDYLLDTDLCHKVLDSLKFIRGNLEAQVSRGRRMPKSPELYDQAIFALASQVMGEENWRHFTDLESTLELALEYGIFIQCWGD